MLVVVAANPWIAYVIVDVLCLVLNTIISGNVTRDSGSETQVRYFFSLLTANLVFVIFDAVWAILVFNRFLAPAEPVLAIVNGVNLLAIALLGYFWLMFSLAHFENPLTTSKKLRVLASVPVALVVVFHIIGYFTGQNIIFNADGTISYGIMHTLCVAVPLFYLLAATMLALHEFRIASTRTDKRLSLTFIMFMVAPAVSGVVDMCVPNTPAAAAGIIISIVFVMMSLQESRISNDALTGLNNRRRAEAFLEDGMSRVSNEEPLHLFLIDMDRFKSINDTYGHLEGDHALQLTADALRRVCAQVNAFAARWGGDEFVIINVNPSETSPDDTARLIQDTVSDIAHDAHVEYDLTCSIGYAVCSSASESRDHLVSSADTMLYRNKDALR